MALHLLRDTGRHPAAGGGVAPARGAAGRCPRRKRHVREGETHDRSLARSRWPRRYLRLTPQTAGCKPLRPAFRGMCFYGAVFLWNLGRANMGCCRSDLHADADAAGFCSQVSGCTRSNCGAETLLVSKRCNAVARGLAAILQAELVCRRQFVFHRISIASHRMAALGWCCGILGLCHSGGFLACEIVC